MSRGIAFSKNKQVKCFSYCSLSLILISLSVISSCVGANREENWGHRANICYQGSPQTGKEGEASIRAKSRSQISPKKKKFCCGVCVPGCTGEKNSTKRRSGGSSPHKRATRRPHQRLFCRLAQQVIITTCSHGSFSLIYSLST